MTTDMQRCADVTCRQGDEADDYDIGARLLDLLAKAAQ